MGRPSQCKRKIPNGIGTCQSVCDRRSCLDQLLRWLLGKKTYKDFIPKMRAKGVPDDQIASNWALANEIARNIQVHDLHPVIRTVYLSKPPKIPGSDSLPFRNCFPTHD